MDLQVVHIGAVILYAALVIISNGNVSGAAASAVASFSDGRCEADGVCPNDPLLFTCELIEINVLRLTLPGQSPVGYVAGVDPDNVNLPAGITVQSSDIPDNAPGNFTLTLSIENASLLAGNEIICDDGTDNNAAMAACPLLGPPPSPSLMSFIVNTTATITWDSVGDDVTYTLTTPNMTVNVGGNLSYTLMDLQVETDYTVTVTATNECGDESPPSTTTVRTAADPTPTSRTTMSTASPTSSVSPSITDTPPTIESGGSSGLPLGAIVGIAVAGVIVVCLLGALVLLVIWGPWRKRKPKSDGHEEDALRLEARTATSPGSGETGATYQDPNTITCTPHPTTGETYTDVNLDKKKKTKEEDAGPMYQDPHTIEHQAAASGELYALPQQEKKKGKKKGKREEEEEEGELSEEQKAALYSVPDKKGQKAKSEGLNYAQLDLHSSSQPAPPSKGSTYVEVKHPPN